MEKPRPIIAEGQSDVRVSKILVHPIKSCRGISVQSARYTPHGLENDRRWCIINADTKVIVTAREIGKMVLIIPRIQVDEASPHGGRIEISFPEDFGCETFAVPLRPSEEILRTWELLEGLVMFGKYKMDGYIAQSLSASAGSPSSILSRYLGRSVHLVYKGPHPRLCTPTTAFPQLEATISYQDGYPLLFLSDESVAAVEARTRDNVGVQGVEEQWKAERLVVERFRPNIIMQGGGPFVEDTWKEITVCPQDEIDDNENYPSISLVSFCTRCLLPNVHTETGIRDGAVPYKILMKFRTGLDSNYQMKPCLGRNGAPSGSGVIRVGDYIRVRKYAE